MNMEKLIEEIQDKLIHVMSPARLDDLLNSCEIVLERDTLISGFIRILKYKKYFLTQETTTKNEVILRLYNNKKNAEELVSEHLETYDRMWDGCGCKVNYYS